MLLMLLLEYFRDSKQYFKCVEYPYNIFLYLFTAIYKQLAVFEYGGRKPSDGSYL